MKISFDGLRRNIALDFNDLAKRIKYLDLDNDLSAEMNILRGSIGGLIACYDSKQMPEDFNDLSEEIKLIEV